MRQGRKKDKSDLIRINDEITASEVRVVSDEDGQFGVMSVDKALQIAATEGVDLVEISPNASPPVCKLIDFGKYRFEMQKREREAKKKQKVIHIKEIKMRPKIDDHDYNFKMNHVRKFLEEGDKVKLTIMFRGREMAHTDLGAVVLEKAIADLGDTIVVEKPAKLEGRNMTVVVTPKK